MPKGLKKIYKILLLEKSQKVSDPIIQKMEQFNFHVIPILNQNDLIKELSSQKVDILILDFLIADEEKNGLDIFLIIKPLLFTAKTILLSSVGDKKYVQLAQQYGIDLFLLKPIKTEKLIQKICEILKLEESDLFTKLNIPFQYRLNHADNYTWEFSWIGCPITFPEKEIKNSIKEISSKLKNAKSILFQIDAEFLYFPKALEKLNLILENLIVQYSIPFEIIKLKGTFSRYLDIESLQLFPYLSQIKIS